MYIKKVPVKCWDDHRRDPTKLMVLFGLWQHEHKTTVLHFTVQRNTEYTGSVRSKVRLYSDGIPGYALMLCYRTP